MEKKKRKENRPERKRYSPPKVITEKVFSVAKASCSLSYPTCDPPSPSSS